MIPEGAVLLTVQIPKSLHKRAKTISKRVRISMTSMVRTALEDRLDQIEAKEREEAARNEQAKAPKRQPSQVGSAVTPLDQRPTVEIPTAKAIDRLAGIFDEHATKIMAVAHDPVQLAIRQQEAFTAIKRMAPLTYADDKKIVSRIEALIMEKAVLEAPDDPAPPEQTSLLRPPPMPMPAATPEVFASMLAPFAKLLEKTDDPIAGKSINPSRVRTRGVIMDDNEENT